MLSEVVLAFQHVSLPQSRGGRRVRAEDDDESWNLLFGATPWRGPFLCPFTVSSELDMVSPDYAGFSPSLGKSKTFS